LADRVAIIGDLQPIDFAGIPQAVEVLVQAKDRWAIG